MAGLQMSKKHSPKKKEQPVKVSKHFIMTVILPCVMLACKDKYKSSPEDLADLSKRINRYIGFIADGTVTLAELQDMMEIRDISKEGRIEGPFTKAELAD